MLPIFLSLLVTEKVPGVQIVRFINEISFSSAFRPPVAAALKVRYIFLRNTPSGDCHMVPVTDVQSHVCIFISHCVENNLEAREYHQLLSTSGFSAFQYGNDLHSGSHIKDTVKKAIEECDFFIFIISDYSAHSDWVQRELGLALRLREASGGYHPVIIPVYSRDASWRRTRRPPSDFLVRDYESGEERFRFNLASVRCLDRYANPEVDGDELLLSELTPAMLVSRVDFNNEDILYSTKTFELYERLFPEHERDSQEDVIQWIFHSDLGSLRKVRMETGDTLEYSLDSRLFIMTLAGRSIGLAFLTYDARSQLIYGNYIAVERSWRSGNLATALFKTIVESAGQLFPNYRGIIFEVEKFDRESVENALNSFDPITRTVAMDDHITDLRKALRVIWYQSIHCYFFVNPETKQPLEARSPCLAPDAESWPDQEDNYWIMWYPKPGEPLDLSNVSSMWAEVVRTIYIEILAKSLVEAYPEYATKYWKYAKAITSNTILENPTATFGNYFYRRDPLLSRVRTVRHQMKLEV